MSKKFDTILKPIALREHSSEQHPFEPLKVVQATHRAEATVVATRLGEVFASIKDCLTDIMAAMRTVPLVSARLRQDLSFCDSADERNTFAPLVSLVEHAAQLKKILAENPAAQAIPDLQRLDQALRPISMTIRVANRSLSPRELFDHRDEETQKHTAIIAHLTLQVANGIDTALSTLDSRSAVALFNIIAAMRDSDGSAELVGSLKDLCRFLTDWRSDISNEDKNYQLVDNLVRQSAELLHQSQSALTSDRQLEAAEGCLKPLFKSVGTIILDRQTMRTIVDYNDTLKELFIKESVRLAIAPEINPGSTSPMTYDITRRLPEALRASAKGLGVNANGNVVAISEDGNPAALADALATLLKTNDTSIYNKDNNKLRRRLAPVVSAAVKEAKAVLRQRAAEEDLRLKQARESLEFAKLFFTEELGESLPRDESVRNALLSKFVAQYTDISQIEARTKAIEAVVGTLQIPKGALSNHYSMYLLTEKEFARWSEQTQGLPALVFRSFQNRADASLILNDLTTYLPNALSNILETLKKNEASATPKE